MELEGGRHRDTTQVKGLSPEINHRVGGRCCSCSSRHNSCNRNGQDCKNPTGSETVSRCQRTDMNSGEPKYPQESMRQQVPKDKESQKVSWQSDYPIVSMKSMKVDGGKGIEGMRLGIGDTSATRERWRGDDNKTYDPHNAGKGKFKIEVYVSCACAQ